MSARRDQQIRGRAQVVIRAGVLKTCVGHSQIIEQAGDLRQLAVVQEQDPLAVEEFDLGPLDRPSRGLPVVEFSGLPERQNEGSQNRHRVIGRMAENWGVDATRAKTDAPEVKPQDHCR